MWGGYPRKIAVPAGARGAEDHPLGQGLLAARETPRLSRLRAPPEPRVRVPEASDRRPFNLLPACREGAGRA